MQLEPMRKYCTAMAWEVYQEYVDHASASDLKGRKEWNRMIKDASLHKFNILLVWKLDRAFRSMDHASTTLNTLNGYNIGFRSYMDPAIDTTTPNGMLVFNLLASVAQFEKDLMILRITEGITYAKEHGTKSGKAIGHPAVDISLQTICKAIVTSQFSYSAAARELSEQFNRKLSAGFISLRIKRAGLTKETLQRAGDFSGVSQG
jgi:DNA invertase Pin-like site-specific DNA recombinase